jgi:LacI family transcriptional regulator
MKRRVTLRDIARELGLHYTTVSLALRNDSRINSATRERVKLEAGRMGYVPDPMVSALSVYRNATKPPSYHGTLAWLVNDAQSQMDEKHHLRTMLDGVRARAAELGYRLEEFLLRSPAMSEQRMSNILQARGIRGLFVAPQPAILSDACMQFDWELFAAVAIGYSLASPRLHLVVNHQVRGAKLAVQRLAACGYRRIGLFLSSVTTRRVDDNWVGGYYTEVSRNPDLEYLPPLFFKDYKKRDAGAFRMWLKRHRPDVVLTDHVHTSHWLMAECGLDPPKEIGLASLYVPTDNEIDSGIDQNDAEIGAAAVDMVVSLLNTNMRGLPIRQRHLLVESTWKQGETIQPALQ